MRVSSDAISTLLRGKADKYYSGGSRDLKAGNRKNDEPPHLRRIRNAIGLPVSVVIG